MAQVGCRLASWISVWPWMRPGGVLGRLAPEIWAAMAATGRPQHGLSSAMGRGHSSVTLGSAQSTVRAWMRTLSVSLPSDALSSSSPFWKAPAQRCRHCRDCAPLGSAIGPMRSSFGSRSLMLSAGAATSMRSAATSPVQVYNMLSATTSAKYVPPCGRSDRPAKGSLWRLGSQAYRHSVRPCC